MHCAAAKGAKGAAADSGWVRAAALASSSVTLGPQADRGNGKKAAPTEAAPAEAASDQPASKQEARRRSNSSLVAIACW